MTPKERATKIMQGMIHEGGFDLHAAIGQAVVEAVEAERATCAKMMDNAAEKCERAGDMWRASVYEQAAEAIRARSNYDAS